MAKDPAFLFYTNDFQSGTLFFTDEQLGIYMRLLMAQHQHGRLTEKQINFICKSYDKDVFSKFKRDENGLFYNERLEYETIRRKNFVESRSKNKFGKTSQKIISKSYDNHMENENENEKGTVNKKETRTKKTKSVESLIPDTWPKDKFLSLWAEYVEMRNKKKRPLTKNAVLRRVQQLVTVSGGSYDQAEKIALRSIDRSYDEFFAIDKTVAEKLPEGYGKTLIRDKA